MTLGYTLVNASTGQLIAEGKSVNVTVDATGQRPVPVPDAARALLEAARQG